jgi:predicted transcriptional regulator
MIEHRKDGLGLIGKFHPADQETFAAIVASNEPISAGVLSKQLGINLTAMNERLSKLISLALVRREIATSAAGREQYEYRVLS